MFGGSGREGERGEGGWVRSEGSARNAAAAPHAEVYIHIHACGKYADEEVMPSSCLRGVGP